MTALLEQPLLRLVVIGLLVAALLGGCGSDDPQTASKPAPAAESTPAIAAPHINSPQNGDVIAATAELGDTRGAKVAVTGTARPNETIQIGSGCPAPNCSSVATADQDGTFSGEVSASTSDDAHRVTITIADSQSDSDRVIITISGDQAAKKPHRKRTPRAKRRRSSNRPRSTPTALPSVTVVPPVATPAPQVTSAPPSSGSSSGTAVVIGDSLAQGMEPYMASALPGWKVKVSARIGRPLAEGMDIFKSAQIQPGAVYAFSLFTNDDPGSVGALEAAVKDSVDRGGCAVWATIVRPALNDVSYDAANQKLAHLKSTLGGRLQLVDWAAAVHAHPSWVPGSDGVHASPEGYRNRAALYAQAISHCR